MTSPPSSKPKKLSPTELASKILDDLKNHDRVLDLLQDQNLPRGLIDAGIIKALDQASPQDLPEVFQIVAQRDQKEYLSKKFTREIEPLFYGLQKVMALSKNNRLSEDEKDFLFEKSLKMCSVDMLIFSLDVMAKKIDHTTSLKNLKDNDKKILWDACFKQSQIIKNQIKIKKSSSPEWMDNQKEKFYRSLFSLSVSWMGARENHPRALMILQNHFSKTVLHDYLSILLRSCVIHNADLVIDYLIDQVHPNRIIASFQGEDFAKMAPLFGKSSENTQKNIDQFLAKAHAKKIKMVLNKNLEEVAESKGDHAFSRSKM